MTLDAQASNLFFQVISVRHDSALGSIATTNIPFGKWNQIFANDAIAHAIVDRLVNEAEIFYMEGTSYREHQREERQKKKTKQKTAGLRLSTILVSINEICTEVCLREKVGYFHSALVPHQTGKTGTLSDRSLQVQDG